MELPLKFKENITQLIGEQEALIFFNSLDQIPSTSIRLNPNKILKQDFSYEKVKWAEYGYFLAERPLFTLDPLLHAGVYYVQDASSMFLEQIIKIINPEDKPLKVLDLCAAPGGKSTHLLSLLSPDSLLVCNEVIKSRASILKENIIKWGYPNVIVTCNDPKDFKKIESYFDIILVDAPCSGEGLFRKDPEAINEWSENNVSLCKERQQRILSDIWGSLKPQGHLIYSTCTFNSLENEGNIEWLCNTQNCNPISLPNIHYNELITGAVQSHPTFKFMPHKTKGEGYFVSCLQKKEELAYSNPSQKKYKVDYPSKKEISHLSQFIQSAKDFNFVNIKGSCTALPKTIEQDFHFLNNHLFVVYAGLEMGEFIHEKFKPAHALALSKCLNRKELQELELNIEQAILYLKREEIKIEETVKSFVLFTYQDIPLGWGKAAGKRINNLYPMEWRIRMRTDNIDPNQYFSIYHNL